MEECSNERTPLEFDDIQPGDVIRHKRNPNWYLVNPNEEGLCVPFIMIFVSYKRLFDEYEIKSIGGDWRDASK
jgi:hypothetical protein